MFKKILSLLLISILVMSSIGSVSAKSYHFDFDYEVGDICNNIDIAHKASDIGIMHQDPYRIDRNIQKSDLFTQIDHYKVQETYSYTDCYVYRTDKVGEYGWKEDYGYAFFQDPDYYHFNIKPHEVKFNVPVDVKHDTSIFSNINIDIVRKDLLLSGEANPLWNRDVNVFLYNVYNEKETHSVNVNLGERDHIDFNDLNLNLNPNSYYGFSITLPAEGNWSKAVIYDSFWT
ncbi:MAG: hypothetical protein LBV42_03630 [Methanobrevibacter sp.]|jgi:hypothetical protein|nr:hypothetical protein [Methanobrevibacter sp.]